ncbi:MAG: hypothetical protein Q8J86_09325 [Desulfurivibrionaceae bacterium]|nr:hypothetical protein [Desulfurivibrionaceae bacterium]
MGILMLAGDCYRLQDKNFMAFSIFRIIRNRNREILAGARMLMNFLLAIDHAVRLPQKH